MSQIRPDTPEHPGAEPASSPPPIGDPPPGGPDAPVGDPPPDEPDVPIGDPQVVPDVHTPR
jgi:hypothetical protein